MEHIKAWNENLLDIRTRKRINKTMPLYFQYRQELACIQQTRSFIPFYFRTPYENNLFLLLTYKLLRVRNQQTGVPQHR